MFDIKDHLIDMVGGFHIFNASYILISVILSCSTIQKRCFGRTKTFYKARYFYNRSL